jgi:hypothetical protein
LISKEQETSHRPKDQTVSAQIRAELKFDPKKIQNQIQSSTISETKTTPKSASFGSTVGDKSSLVKRNPSDKKAKTTPLRSTLLCNGFESKQDIAKDVVDSSKINFAALKQEGSYFAK